LGNNNNGLGSKNAFGNLLPFFFFLFGGKEKHVECSAGGWYEMDRG
jgi:hypothetical protein